MSRTVRPLTDQEMAFLVEHLDQLSTVGIANRLRRCYFTIHKAVKRVREHGWATALHWNTCTECSLPVASGPMERTCHIHCERVRIVRTSRESRRRRPGQSTEHVRRWRQEHPAEAAQLGIRSRETEKAKRQEWSDCQWAPVLNRVHEADRRDQETTREEASSSDAVWTEAEDQYVIDHMGTPAREVALELGRTLWAVRTRRVYLRHKLGIEDTYWSINARKGERI